MGIATCIGCGCDDQHACWDEAAGSPCGWLVVDYADGLGVCSTCPDHLERWNAGDRTMAREVLNEAVGELDALLANAGLPTYAELLDVSQTLIFTDNLQATIDKARSLLEKHRRGGGQQSSGTEQPAILPTYGEVLAALDGMLGAFGNCGSSRQQKAADLASSVLRKARG